MLWEREAFPQPVSPTQLAMELCRGLVWIQIRWALRDFRAMGLASLRTAGSQSNGEARGGKSVCLLDACEAGLLHIEEETEVRGPCRVPRSRKSNGELNSIP